MGQSYLASCRGDLGCAEIVREKDDEYVIYENRGPLPVVFAGRGGVISSLALLVLRHDLLNVLHLFQHRCGNELVDRDTKSVGDDGRFRTHRERQAKRKDRGLLLCGLHWPTFFAPQGEGLTKRSTVSEPCILSC